MANLAKTLRAMKSEQNQVVHALARYAPAEVKRAIVEQNYEAAMTGLAKAIKGDDQRPCPLCQRTGNPEPWAIRAWLEAAGAVGAPHIQIAIANFMQERLGIHTESEAVALVEDGRRFQRIRENVADNWEHQLEQGVELVKALLQLHPERRPSVVSELGGIVPITNGGKL